MAVTFRDEFYERAGLAIPLTAPTGPTTRPLTPVRITAPYPHLTSTFTAPDTRERHCAYCGARETIKREKRGSYWIWPGFISWHIAHRHREERK